MRVLAVSALAAAVLGGCASFEPLPLSPSGTAAHYESRALDSSGLRAFMQKNRAGGIASWPLSQWDLDALVLAAFYYHPDLDLARARWQVAEAAIATAGMLPNPAVGLGVQRNADAPGGTSPWTLGWSFDVPVETAGKRGYRTDQARHLSEAARLAIAGTAWQVRSRLRAGLVDTQFAQQAQVLLLRQQSLQQNNVALLERRLILGMASQPEVTQARIALNRTTLALSENRKTRVEAQEKLAVALGVSDQSIAGIPISPDLFGSLPAAPVDAGRRAALLSRSDILIALAEYAASQSALQLEVARQYPDLHLGPGYTWDAGERKWSLGLSLALPIFNRNQGPIAEATALRAQAMANFNAVQARAIGEIDGAAAGYRAMLGELAAADALASEQGKRARGAMASFKAGETDKVALLGAQLEQVQVDLSRLDALAKTEQALGVLEDAMQRALNDAAQ